MASNLRSPRGEAALVSSRWQTHLDIAPARESDLLALDERVGVLALDQHTVRNTQDPGTNIPRARFISILRIPLQALLLSNGDVYLLPISGLLGCSWMSSPLGCAGPLVMVMGTHESANTAM